MAAARRGCVVTSTDYVGSLLERGAERARADRLEVTFQTADAEALQREVMALTEKFFALSHAEMQLNFPPPTAASEDIMPLVYAVAKLLPLDLAKEQQLLAAPSDKEAIKLLNEFLNHEIQILEVHKKISDQAKEKLSEEQQKYLLREQIKAMQQQLGEGPTESETTALRDKLANSGTN